MIHPPPEAFARAAELARLRQTERREISAPARMLAWTAAAALTLGLHVGLYLLLTRSETPPPKASEMPAAVMVDLAPIAVTAKSEVDNSANGPPADASEQTEPEPAAEAPPPPAPQPVIDVPPPPPEVKPQAALPPKPPEARRIEDERRQQKIEKEKQRRKIEKERIAKEKLKQKIEKERHTSSRAGGGPRADRQTAAVTAASAAGATVSEASRASWLNDIRTKIVRAKRFPSEAHGQSGISMVSVTFGANGGASGVRLVASSGNAALDAEAVAVMYRAAPYPPPPGGRSTTLTVPLNFRR